jgi:hypothetical protein
MLDPHAAQPQFLARCEAMDIVAGSDPHGARAGREIGGEGQLVQGLVSLDQRNLDAGGACATCASSPAFGSPMPGAVRGQDCVEAERLRGLHPAQRLARRGHAHHVGPSAWAMLNRPPAARDCAREPPERPAAGR